MAETYPTRSLRELARVLFSRWAGIIVILVVVIGAVVAATLLSRWKYRSRALLQARPTAPLTAGEGWTTMKDRISLFVITQRELAKSDHVLASALMRMDRSAKPPDGFVGPDKQKWYTEQTVAEYAAQHTREIADCRDRVTVETPGGPDVNFTQTFTLMVTWPEERELAKQLGETDSRSFAARRAHQFLAYLVSAYRARRAEVETSYAKTSAEYFLKNATALAYENLERCRNELTDYVTKELNLDPILAESIVTRADEIGSQGLATKFKVEIKTIEATIVALDTMAVSIGQEFAKGTEAKVVVPDELLKANPALVKMLDAIATLRLKLNNLVQQYTENFEEIKQTRAELAANMADLGREMVVMIQQKRQTELARLKQFQDAVTAETKIVSDLAAKAPQYKQLKANFDSAQEIYNQRQAEAIEAQGAEALAAAPVEVRVLDAPSRADPERPYRPILWLNILVGTVAGLILSMIYAFAADHFDHSLKGMDDVERHVGIGVLASIPRFRRRMIRAQ